MNKCNSASSSDAYPVRRYLIGIADVGRADVQQMGFFSSNGLYGVEYLHGAFVVYGARALWAVLTAGAGRENDRVRPAKCFRERRDR